MLEKSTSRFDLAEVTNRLYVTLFQMEPQIESLRLALGSSWQVVFEPATSQGFGPLEMQDKFADARALVVGDDVLNGEVLGRLEGLKFVIRWGAGIDNVDLEAAEALGIRVVNTPGMLGPEVAELALGHCINLVRKISDQNASISQGEWPKKTTNSCSTMRLGIVGYGSVGQEFARISERLFAAVKVYDPLASDVSQSGVVRVTSIESIWIESDLIVLCAPLTGETFHLVNEQSIAKMRNGVYIVNVGRGELIDSDDLANAIKSGKVAGAALDVFEIEPLSPKSQFLGLANLVMTSHNASNCFSSITRVNREVERLAVSLSRQQVSLR